MAEKLSWTELRRALAARAGITEKEANNFLSAFSAQLVEALKSDKQVKINGLGIFKLQAVAPRKSINVTTGEEITIEGYNKIAFAPEAGVKELIEKTEVSTPADIPAGTIDPIQKLGAQAEEIVDILGDLGQSPKEESPKEQTPLKEEPQMEKPIIEQPQIQEPMSQEKPFIPGVGAQEQPAPEKPKKKHHFVRDVLICVVVLLLLLFGAYFFCRTQMCTWLDNLIHPQTALVQDTLGNASLDENALQEAQPLAQEETLSDEELMQAQILAEFLEASGELDDLQDGKGQELSYAGWITVEPMHQDSRLAWMAKRYYGAKIYWPYLFDTNRDRFTNPNMIETGTPIRVPRLTAVQKDTTNARTLADLERLRLQAEALMR